MRCTNFILSDNGEGDTLLYYNPNSNMEPKVVVKKGEARLAIKIIHERLGHLGQKATIRKDTIRFVFDCAVCNKKKEIKGRNRSGPAFAPSLPPRRSRSPLVQLTPTAEAEMDLVEGDLEEAEAFVADRLMLNEAQLTQEAELIDAVMRNERAAYSAAGSRGRRVPMYRFADELEAYADEYLDGDDSQMLDDDDEDAMREAEYLEQISGLHGEDPGGPVSSEDAIDPVNGETGGSRVNRKREMVDDAAIEDNPDSGNVQVAATGRGSPKRARIDTPQATRVTTRSRATMGTGTGQSPAGSSAMASSPARGPTIPNPPTNPPPTKTTPITSTTSTRSTPLQVRGPPAASSSGPHMTAIAIRRNAPGGGSTRPPPSSSRNSTHLNGSSTTGRFSGLDPNTTVFSSTASGGNVPVTTYHHIAGGEKYAYADTTLGAAVLMHPTDREVVRLQKQVLVLQKQVLMLQRQHLRQKIEHYAFFQANQQLQLVEEQQVEDGGEIVTSAHGGAGVVAQQQQQQHLNESTASATQNLLAAAAAAAAAEINVEE